MARSNEPGMTTKHSKDPTKRWARELEQSHKDSYDPANSDSAKESVTRNHLISIIEEHDGYLKVRMDMSGEELHLTWTWTIGQWAGHYVYVRVFTWQVDYGLALIMDKMQRVNDGWKVPTRDKRGSSGA